jgi:SEC-C motif-containing protein
MTEILLCPCGSEKNYSACCEPYVSGSKKAPTAEALMRSRYTAYTKAIIPYILETLHPSQRKDFDEKGVAKWAKESDWMGLSIHETVKGGSDDTTGEVIFTAKFKQNGVIRDHRERAEFKKQSDIWYFFDGKPLGQEQVRREASKVGRNDPCSCGSGKKYKKCCG